MQIVKAINKEQDAREQWTPREKGLFGTRKYHRAMKSKRWFQGTLHFKGPTSPRGEASALQQIADAAWRTLTREDHGDRPLIGPGQGEKQEVRRLVLDVIIANFASVAMAQDHDDNLMITTPLGGKRRKFPNTIPGTRTNVTRNEMIKGLVDAGWLDGYVSRRRGKASGFEPRPWFVKLIKDSGIEPDDFVELAPDEGTEGTSAGSDIKAGRLIILTPTEYDYVKGKGGGLKRRAGDVIEFDSLPQDAATAAMLKTMKADVAEINEGLAAADITVEDTTEPTLLLRNQTQRRLQRRFKLPENVPLVTGDTFLADPDSDHDGQWLNGDIFRRYGGRLYGAFWINLPKAVRHRLRIDGERIADLDYNSMFVRLAYARIGITLADDAEPYPEFKAALIAEAITEKAKGFKKYDKQWQWRQFKAMKRKWSRSKVDDAAKTLMLTFFNKKVTHARDAEDDNGPAPRRPRDVVNLPRAFTGKVIWRAIKKSYPELVEAGMIGGGKIVGYELMHTESEIMMAVLLRLKRDHGIVALPIHDGLMVAKSKASIAKNVMNEEALRITGGVSIPVKVKEWLSPWETEETELPEEPI